MNSRNQYSGERDPYDLPSADPREERRAQRRQEQRRLMESASSSFVLGLLVLCYAAAILFLIFFPRSTESQIEKRELAKFPDFSIKSYFSGEYTTGIAAWYNDTVPYHDGFKNLGNNIKAVFGLPKSDNSVEFFGQVNKVPGKKDPADPAVSNAPGGSQPTAVPTVQEQISVSEGAFFGAAGRHVSVEGGETDNPFTQQEAEGSWENGLIIVKQNGHYRGLELFGGGGGASYAEGLNTLREKLGDNVAIWSMPAPLACEFYTPSNYQEYTASQTECFDNVAQKLDPGIHSINICGDLSSHAGEDIYCRTDHHWQPLGAYYAAKSFAAAAGVPFADLSAYTTGKNEGFVGTMYSFTGSSDILNDPEDFVYFVPTAPYEAHYYDTSFNYNYTDDLFAKVDTANSYLMFMGGDQQVIKVDTQVENGRKLLVVKDSYGNAEIPFYTSSFEQIYVIDVRYFNCNLVSLVQQMGITDVLFSMSAFSVVGENAENITNLITQNEGETIIDTQLDSAGQASAE